ncbi:MAG: hypothetical protein ABEJ56_03065 [Candidatus Nanohaloarchaea archaeon]
MIEFTCENCGEKREENVLPGKHAIMGCIRSLEKSAECCGAPHYQNSSRGLNPGAVQKDLREMATSRA